MERHTKRQHQRIYLKPCTTCSSFLHEDIAKLGLATSTRFTNCLWHAGGSALDKAEGCAARRAGDLQLTFSPPAVAAFPGCEKGGWTSQIPGLSQFNRLQAHGLCPCVSCTREASSRERLLSRAAEASGPCWLGCL